LHERKLLYPITLLAIKPVTVNVPLDRGRNQPFDRLTACDLPAYFGRAHRLRWNWEHQLVELLDLGGVQAVENAGLVLPGVTRSCDRHDTAQFEDLGQAVPTVELRDGIRSDDEEELSLRETAPEVPQGVNRVGRPGAFQFTVISNKRRIALHRKLDHCVSVGRRGLVLALLVRGNLRGYKVHGLQAEEVSDMPGHR